MPGEFFEPRMSETSSVAVSELAVGEGEAGAEAGAGRTESGHAGVALLLTATAIVAAIIGFRAATVSSAASDSWQSALRTEVKRSAGAVEDVRYLYQTELPVAVMILRARVVEAEMEAAAQTKTGAEKAALLVEARVQAQMITAMSASSDLATKPEYTLPSGAFDLAKRLADLRAKSPAMLTLDPDALVAEGDKLAQKAEYLTLALLPASLAALIGVMAQPFKRRRTMLLQIGTVVLATSAAMAVAVEVLA